jgi:hypothetical protein
MQTFRRIPESLIGSIIEHLEAGCHTLGVDDSFVCCAVSSIFYKASLTPRPTVTGRLWFELRLGQQLPELTKYQSLLMGGDGFQGKARRTHHMK